MARGVPAPNHTQTPNYLLDHLHLFKSEAELKVVLTVVRKTFGWHKDRDVLSLTQLQAATGMSRRSVIDGAEAAIAHGWIDRVPAGRGFAYSLVVRDSEETAPSAHSSETAPIDAGDSAETAPMLVQKLHTQKKEKETKNLNKNTLGAGAPASGPDPVKELATVFTSVTKIQMPEPSTNAQKARSYVGVKWWNPLQQMVKLANGSSAEILREVVADMDARKLTIADPNSVLKVFIAKAAERARRSDGGSTGAAVERDANGIERVALTDQQQALADLFNQPAVVGGGK